ncbi:MAG: antimicrobial resistance protein Mig-14 [Betaproteobacteria bacterium]|nr:antimicrobial resistance protein Mig-14 [Betaproteobacteria bacterium]
MLNRIRAFREKGWVEISPSDYAQAWQQYGGSVATHPAFVELLSEFAEIPVRYLGWQWNGMLVAALPVWGRYLALSSLALRAAGKKRIFDLGNPEVVLPVAPGAEQVPLRHVVRFLSARHEADFQGLKRQKEKLAFLKPPEAFSAKFRKNERRNLRQFAAMGGVARPVNEFSPNELASIYLDLFQRRWGFAPAGAAGMAEVLALLRDWMIGFVIQLNGLPVAVQVIYRVESPQWISVEYVNGGVDPATFDFSMGNVLTYLNTDAAREEATAAGKPLRYSFGRVEPGYKTHWCLPESVFRV